MTRQGADLPAEPTDSRTFPDVGDDGVGHEDDHDGYDDNTHNQVSSSNRGNDGKQA